MSTLREIIVREVLEKLRSRAFWVVNALLLAVLVAAVAVPALLGDDGPDELTVVAVGTTPTTIAQRAADFAPADELALVVETVPDRDAAEQALRDEEADLALVSADRLVARGDPDTQTASLLDSARRVTLLDDALADAGVDQQQRSQLLTPAPIEQAVLDGGDEDDRPSGTAVGTGLTTVFVLYGLLIFYGQQIAQGIVQEKQSRVIEVLLATVRPMQLLGGKLLGLGLVGLAQIAGLAAIGYGTLAVVGRADIPAEVVPTLLSAVAFFVLGYVLYATIFALAAVVVAKIEDLQTAMTVPILLLVGSLFLAQLAIAEPEGTIAVVGALLPTSAPVVQPLLIAVGAASPLLVVLSVLSTLVTAALLLPLAARVHAGAALVTRQRVSVREALERERT